MPTSRLAATNASPALLPAVRLRLSHRQAGFIIAGLKIIVGNYRRYQSGTLPMYPLWLLPVHRRRDLGQHDADVLNKILHLQPSLARAGRLRLDAVGLAACILSVRVGMTQVRRGHSRPLERGHFDSARAVI